MNNKVKELTNFKIGYENFEREEQKRNKKIKNSIFSILVVGLLVGGGFTVNALTDNSIGKTIDRIISVTFNGKNYNADCKQNKDGSYSCIVDGDILLDDDYNSFPKVNSDVDLNNHALEIQFKKSR